MIDCFQGDNYSGIFILKNLLKDVVTKMCPKELWMIHPEEHEFRFYTSGKGIQYRLLPTQEEQNSNQNSKRRDIEKE